MRLYKFAEQSQEHTEAVKERTSPWKLGGLTPLQLSKRVYHEIDEDEVEPLFSAHGHKREVFGTESLDAFDFEAVPLAR